ncbi:MAG: HDIG domain-containing protein [Actinobacteria bacterium]|nr:HDIG domain-containing protein [Actinomycetota bacterium]
MTSTPDNTQTDVVDDDPAATLSMALVAKDPTRALWELVDSGWSDTFLPELPQLRLEQDPVHRHKDVLTHTIVVTAQAPARLRVRLAALFHDVGKPRTRKFASTGVTFHHHEAVGAKMARKRMRKLGFDDTLVREVTQLVFLSGRFKGYADGWSDSAVRRYARDAGPLLGDLNDLVRSDCTSRNPRRVDALHRLLDGLEERIQVLAREDAVKAERPEVDGAVVMAHLGIEAGPAVGQAMKFLLRLKRTEGSLGETEVLERLDVWWRQNQG